MEIRIVIIGIILLIGVFIFVGSNNEIDIYTKAIISVFGGLIGGYLVRKGGLMP